LPEEDVKYFGSFKDKTFKPTKKIIIKEFTSREAASNVEITLHNFFNVAENLNFANRAKSTSTGFTRLGAKNTKKTNEKIALVNKGNKYCVGRKISEETRKKISKGNKGKKISEERKQALRKRMLGKNNPTYGKARPQDVKDKISVTKKKTYVKENHPMFNKTHSKNAREKIVAAQKKISVRLMHCVSGEIVEFSSQLEAAKALNLHQGSISSLLLKKLKTTGGWRLA
jgi:hypothetical protein